MIVLFKIICLILQTFPEHFTHGPTWKLALRGIHFLRVPLPRSKIVGKTPYYICDIGQGTPAEEIQMQFSMVLGCFGAVRHI